LDELPAWHRIADLDLHHITTAKLTVDRKIEERPIPHTPSYSGFAIYSSATALNVVAALRVASSRSMRFF